MNLRTASGLAALFIVFFFASTVKVDAATVFETSSKDSILSLQATGACCSGADNYRPYNQVLSGVPQGVPFDRVVFYASSSNASLPVNLTISNDLNSSIASQSFGVVGTLNGIAGDTTVTNDYVLAYALGGGKFQAVLPTPRTLNSGQYVSLTFTGQSYIAVFDKQNLSGFRWSTNQIPTGTYTVSQGTVVAQLCFTVCGTLGAWSSVSTLQYVDVFNTKFLSGTVTGSSNSTVTFNISYFLDTLEFTVGNRPDFVSITVVSDKTGTSDTQLTTLNNLILPLGNGTTTKSFLVSTNHPNGDYIAYISFWNIQNNSITFAKTSLTLKYTITNSGVSTYSQVSVTNSTTNSATDYEECTSFLDVGCGIRNAFKYLFVPSTDSISSFTNLKNVAMTKAPFIYVLQTSDIFNTVYVGRSGSVPTISIPFMSGSVVLISQAQLNSLAYVSTLRSLVAMGIYLTLLYGLYRMALRIHDNVTPA